MRTVKFDNTKNNYDSDDIKYAFGNNGLTNRLKDIDVIVAEVCGQNDDDDWYWILQLKDGSFAWAVGGCDYTGWDCQSSCDLKDGFSTPQEAIDDLKLSTYESRENIKLCLEKQIKDELPFAMYTSNP